VPALIKETQSAAAGYAAKSNDKKHPAALPGGEVPDTVILL